VNLFQIDQHTCSRDGICAAICPARLISFQETGYPTPIEGAEELCMRCGHCVAVCPSGSFSHSDMSVGQCSPVQKDLQLSVDQCEHFLRNRRSIRLYRDKPVPRADISRLIEIARYAPSGHNCQCAEWLVLDNRDELQNLAGIVADWMRWMLENMREMSLSWHLDRTLKNWESGEDVILRDAPVVIITHAAENNRMAPSTCAIALTYLELASTAMGLGSCWAGYFNAAATSFPPMKKALSLPDGHLCFGAMMVGYPMFGYHRLPTRRLPSISWR
jgi:nitroreductase/NAD-dependent dihydropyrimidine dehydrogenase PreA subunit